MTAIESATFRSSVRDKVTEMHLLNHPFYVAWTQGLLSRDGLRAYAGQYMHHVLAEPTYLSAVHSNTPHFTGDTIDLQARQTILSNLIDEEFGPRNHPALWMRFAAALGLSEQELAATPRSESTRSLIETFSDLCRNRPYYVGLAAMHAFESQVPAIAAAKIEGLKKYYGFDDPASYEFFTVHQSADVAHSEAEWLLIERAADSAEKQDEVIASTTRACEALWSFLSGVYRA